MKKSWGTVLSLVMAVILLVGVLAGCQGSGQGNAPAIKELVLYTWQYYVPDDVIADFEEQTGYKIIYNYFDDSDDMLTKVQATGGAEHDVIIASDYAIDIMRNEDLLYKIDKEKVPNYENLDPNFMSEFYDPNNEYTVPYAGGTPLIIYDPSRVDFEITGYNDLWDERLEDSVVFLDYARVMVGLVLKSMDYSLNETDPALLAQAEEKLLKLAPNIRALNAESPYNVMLSGEASVGLMYGSQVAWVYNERPDFTIVYPSEGMGFGIDCAFIPAKAPNAEGAHAFLNFICDPEISARISMDENVMSFNCNQKAGPYLSDEFKANPVLYIPADKMVGREFIKDIGADAAEKYTEIWNRFKQSLT